MRYKPSYHEALRPSTACSELKLATKNCVVSNQVRGLQNGSLAGG
jgi:hypothetical protein